MLKKMFLFGAALIVGAGLIFTPVSSPSFAQEPTTQEQVCETIDTLVASLKGKGITLAIQQIDELSIPLVLDYAVDVWKMPPERKEIIKSIAVVNNIDSPLFLFIIFFDDKGCSQGSVGPILGTEWASIKLRLGMNEANA